MVILGPATNEMGANCWVAAYDIKTGKELWRFDTAPNSADLPEAKTWVGDSWKHGGSPIWNAGSYDPETNLTFWGTGNPNPGWNGDIRTPADNLYSNCVIALDADTGKLKWHYQFTPGDEYDWDATQVPVLVDMEWQGRPRKLMLWANRNGFFYVLDRVTGQFLLGKAFVKQTWNLGFDEKGRPIKNPEFWPKPMGGIEVFPGTQGGTNYYPPSYSPRTGLFYLAAWENYSSRSGKYDPGPWKERVRYTGSTPPPGHRRARRWPRVAAAGDVQKRRRGLRHHPGARSQDRREEVGLQDGRLHAKAVCSDDRVGSAFRRRARGASSSRSTPEPASGSGTSISGAPAPAARSVTPWTANSTSSALVRARCSCSVCRSRGDATAATYVPQTAARTIRAHADPAIRLLPVHPGAAV